MGRRHWYVIVGLLLLESSGAGQLAHLWSFEELTAKSDIVAIAAYVATRDTGLKAELAELTPQLPVVELSTEFRLLVLVKGNAADTILLRHYRQDRARLPGGCLNCSSELNFAARGADRHCGPGTARPPYFNCAYMLFLKRDASGALVPTSGQVFPSDSVFALDSAK